MGIYIYMSVTLLRMRTHVRVPCERAFLHVHNMCVLLPSRPRSSWYENAFLHVRIANTVQVRLWRTRQRQRARRLTLGRERVQQASLHCFAFFLITAVLMDITILSARGISAYTYT